MRVSEILDAISKFRKEKLIHCQNRNIRSHTPIQIPHQLSKKNTPIRERNHSPVSPCVCETSYILPKTRHQLRNFLDSQKYHQIMEYKLDAAGLILSTIQKYKKRIFYAFEKNVRVHEKNLEVSFTHFFENSENFIEKREKSPKRTGKFFCEKKESFGDTKGVFDKKNKSPTSISLIQKSTWNSLLELNHSPSFNGNSHSSGYNSNHFNYTDCLNRLKQTLSKIFRKQKIKIFGDLLQIIEYNKKVKILEKFSSNLKFFYKRFVFDKLQLRSVSHKRTWELPLRLDMKKLAQRKNDTIEVSSVDESEVIFEPNLENSSQYTTRFQHSIERNVRDLNLSSITSNDDRSFTDRILNFTRARQPAKFVSVRPSCEVSDSSIEFKSKIVKVSNFNFNKIKNFKQTYQRPLVQIFFVIENHFKKFLFEEIKIFFKMESKSKRNKTALDKIYGVLYSKLEFFLFNLRRSCKVQGKLDQISKIFKNCSKFLLLKRFGEWKMSNYAQTLERNSKSDGISNAFSNYLHDAKRALQNMSLIINFKLKFLLFHAYSDLKSHSKSSKYLRISGKCLAISIKRLQNTMKNRNLRLTFFLILNLTRESKIKLSALNSMTKNINKDLKFRLKVCFGHWKSEMLSLKNLHLICLSFVQTIHTFYLSRKKSAFRHLFLNFSKLSNNSFHCLPNNSKSLNNSFL